MLRRLMMAAGGGAPAGYPVVIGSPTTTASGSSVSSRAINIPAHDAGDRLLMVFVNDGTTGVTTPTNWQLVGSHIGSLNARTTVFYRDMPSSGASGVVSVTTSSSEEAVAIVLRIEAGTFAGAPEWSAHDQSGSTTKASPGLSPSWGSAPTLLLALFGSDASATTVSSYPLPRDQTLVSSGGGSGCVAAICHADENSSPYNPGNWSTPRTGGVAIGTLAVRGA